MPTALGRSVGIPHAFFLRSILSGGAYIVIVGALGTDRYPHALAIGGKVTLGQMMQSAQCEWFLERDAARTLFAKKCGARVVRDCCSGARLRLSSSHQQTLRHPVRVTGSSGWRHGRGVV